MFWIPQIVLKTNFVSYFHPRAIKGSLIKVTHVIAMHIYVWQMVLKILFRNAFAFEYSSSEYSQLPTVVSIRIHAHVLVLHVVFEYLKIDGK